MEKSKLTKLKDITKQLVSNDHFVKVCGFGFGIGLGMLIYRKGYAQGCKDIVSKVVHQLKG